jgi:hypothetical protein
LLRPFPAISARDPPPVGYGLSAFRELALILSDRPFLGAGVAVARWRDRPGGTSDGERLTTWCGKQVGESVPLQVKRKSQSGDLQDVLVKAGAELCDGDRREGMHHRTSLSLRRRVPTVGRHSKTKAKNRSRSTVALFDIAQVSNTGSIPVARSMRSKT